MSADERRDRIAGVLLGTAVGDALGLPREGLSPKRAWRMLGDEERHAGAGLVSGAVFGRLAGPSAAQPGWDLKVFTAPA